MPFPLVPKLKYLLIRAVHDTNGVMQPEKVTCMLGKSRESCKKKLNFIIAGIFSLVQKQNSSQIPLESIKIQADLQSFTL